MGTFISTLLKIISIMMTLVFIASVLLLIFTFRKPRKVSVLSLIITIAISLLTLVIFSSLIKYEPPFWLWIVMAVIGIAVGWFWARTTRVYIKGEQVMSQNSIWYLVVWGAVFAINQLITIITNRPPDIAMALLILSTATVWGTNGDIIRRYFKIRGVLQPQSASQTAQTSAKSNLADGTTLVKPTATTFRAASTPEPLATSLHKDADKPPASALSKCPACGARLFEGDAFCMKCGGKL